MLYISIAINILIVGGFAVKRYMHTLKTKSSNVVFADIWNESRTNTYNSLPIYFYDIVFIGDSNIEAFPLSEYFPGKNIKNRGISGNTSTHVLSRIKYILEKKPGKVFLQIGGNDLIARLSMDSTIQRYTTILAYADQFEVPVIAQSILPTSGKYKHALPDIEKFNGWLKKFCETKRITYVDLFNPFLKNGELDNSVTLDGLHLNAKGYGRWKTVLETYLN